MLVRAGHSVRCVLTPDATRFVSPLVLETLTNHPAGSELFAGAGDASVPKVAVGETPNLAARIQGLAESDQIIIGPDTRHLVGGTFNLEDFGEHALKGIVEPVRAWRIVPGGGAAVAQLVGGVLRLRPKP